MKRKTISSSARKMLQSGGTTAVRQFGTKHAEQPIGKALKRGQMTKGGVVKGKR